MMRLLKSVEAVVANVRTLSKLSSRGFLLTLLALALGGCSDTQSYRYKLTLAVNTPDGVKRASSVVEVFFSSVSVPAHGVLGKLRGEALYLDLGPGERPLIALLTNTLHHTESGYQHWSPSWGPSGPLISRLFGVPNPDKLENVTGLSKVRASRRLTTEDLPDLVTFDDVERPDTVIEVDPDQLQSAFSQPVTWNEMTLEITDEPITTGITAKLSWLPKYFDQNLNLDGSKYRHANGDIANRLGWFQFDQSGKLQRTK